MSINTIEDVIAHVEKHPGLVSGNFKSNTNTNVQPYIGVAIFKAALAGEKTYTPASEIYPGVPYSEGVVDVTLNDLVLSKDLVYTDEGYALPKATIFHLVGVVASIKSPPVVEARTVRSAFGLALKVNRKVPEIA